MRVVLSLALLVSPIACEAREARVTTEEYSILSEGQAFSVYAVVLADFLGRHGGPVVVDPQTSFEYSHDMWAHCYESVEAQPFVTRALWQALPEVNATPARLEPEAAARLLPSLSVVPIEQREALLAAGYPGSNEFTETFPGQRLIQVSRVAFNPAEDESLVYVWITGGGCGQGAVYALAREGSVWAVTFRHGLGAS